MSIRQNSQAATSRWLGTGAGTLAWIVVLCGSIAALVVVFRQYREHGS